MACARSFFFFSNPKYGEARGFGSLAKLYTQDRLCLQFQIGQEEDRWIGLKAKESIRISRGQLLSVA